MTKVLIVDDDPDFQEFVCALFELEGFEPHAAFDGDTALELYERVKPDVILLDIMMPGMDGYELLRQLRDDQGASTPVILVSAKAAQEDIRRGMEAGADDYITKPFDFSALLEAVQKRVGDAARD